MRRDETEDGDLPGQDSFLDIVANMVGILILLVMVVGVRAAMRSEPAPVMEATEPLLSEADVEQEEKRTAAAIRETQDLIQRAARTVQEAQFRDEERVSLATFAAQMESDLESQRAALTEDEQQEFDLQQQLAQAQSELKDLTRQRVAIASAEPEAEVIEVKPTPIGKIVSGDEVELRLKAGRVAYIPSDALINEAKRQLPRISEEFRRAKNDSEYAEVLGPTDGFRLRLVLARQEVTLPGRGIVRVSGVSHGIFEPEHDQIGEPVEQAVLPESELRRRLGAAPSTRASVTVWVYSDSFAEMRQLKQTLTDMGYAIAERPLADGDPIGFASSGTKSVAQ